MLRYALERYAAEHGGQYPVDDVAKQLTYYSDYQGISMSLTKDVANGVVYGPYLKAIPPLPVGSKKGATGIYESSNTGELPPEGVASDGWFYNSVDQVFKANLADIDVDDDGFRYNTY